MKRKFVLLPITLTALAPAISLVGCGDPDKPESEYEDIKLVVDHWASDPFDIYENHYYKIWDDAFFGDASEVGDMGLELEPFNGSTEKIDVEVIKVEVVNSEIKEYEISESSGCWDISFVPIKNKSYAVYIKANQTKLNWYAHWTG